jgi:hypothetical protein
MKKSFLPAWGLEGEPMFDVHRSIEYPDGEINWSVVGNYVRGLRREFLHSPEARAFVHQHGRVNWVGLLIDFGIKYLGLTPPEMSVADFREVVFQLFPRKVMATPDTAAAIVAEQQAFWTFLQRAYGLANSAPILAALNDRAVGELKRELSNPENFDEAKSFFTLGEEMGYDMKSEEGLQEFTRFYNEAMTGEPFEEDEIDDFEEDDDFPEDTVSLPPVLTPKERAELRKKRKQQRQARKRNRRKK